MRNSSKYLESKKNQRSPTIDDDYAFFTSGYRISNTAPNKSVEDDLSELNLRYEMCDFGVFPEYFIGFNENNANKFITPGKVNGIEFLANKHKIQVENNNNNF